MNIIIVGAGTVGFSLAELFSQHGHHISVIEADRDISDEIKSQLDVLSIHASGTSPTALELAGIREAGMVVAVTPNDEINLLVCAFAKQYGVSRRIARIVSGEYSAPELNINLAEVGVTDVIETEKEVVKSILQHIELPGATETVNFQLDNVFLRGYRVTENMPLANKSLAEIKDIAGSDPILVVVIIRNRQSILPTGDHKLLPGDEFISIMPRESFATFKKLIGQGSRKLSKIVVSGDTLTAVHLADSVKPYVERVILVDPDPKHVETAARILDGVEVLNGDCTKTEVLQDIHINNVDFFIAAGKDTEDNVMSCLLAKAEGTREVVAINNTNRYGNLFRSLGLDHIIVPKKIAAQKILRSVLRMPMRDYLGVDKAEILVVHITAKKNSKITTKPLKDFDKILKKSIIFGAVMRDENVIIPRGDTRIEKNDEVIVLCHRKQEQLVARLFK